MLLIRPYKPGSASVKNLIDTLGKPNLKKISPDRSAYRVKENDIIVNWGCTRNKMAQHGHCYMMNPIDEIKQVSNKLAFFNFMSQYPGQRPRIPSFTVNKEAALQWLVEAPDGTIVIREKLASHSGIGIKLFTRENLLLNEELPDAPLYTKYIKKQNEYRVHLVKYPKAMGPAIFFAQEKKRKAEFNNPNWQIRNLANGFIYANEHVDLPADVVEQAYRAFKASELDFGAVDVIWNNTSRKAYVLEINTAPGLTGKTLEAYAETIKQYANEVNDLQGAPRLFPDLAAA